MGSNIVLIGMPASGKSTIGAILADRLPDYVLYDTDSIIEKTAGMKITDIFEKYSEDYFRKLEYDTIKLVANGNNKIISIGGGAFENPDNRITLLKNGIVFYLKSDLDVLYYRISGDISRPLLNNENPRQVLENLLKKREANFMKANHVISIDELSEDEIIDFILGRINETDS